MSHTEQVAAYFHNPRPYLQRSYNITLRREIVQEMVGNLTPARILDIGCGDGSLSLQLLKGQTRLVLLDLSEQMLAEARANVPAELGGNVEALCGDLMSTELEPGGFDLILCMGVLAHVDSPADFIRKVCSLLRPGGSAVVTVSCGRHFFGRMRKLYLNLRDAIKQPLYRVKWLAASDVIAAFASHGVRVAKSFRYNFPAPGMDRMLTNDRLYRAIRKRHGTVENNRLAFLGSEYILCLRKDLAREPGEAGRRNGQKRTEGNAAAK